MKHLKKYCGLSLKSCSIRDCLLMIFNFVNLYLEIQSKSEWIILLIHNL